MMRGREAINKGITGFQIESIEQLLNYTLTLFGRRFTSMIDILTNTLAESFIKRSIIVTSNDTRNFLPLIIALKMMGKDVDDALDYFTDNVLQIIKRAAITQ